MKRKETIGMRWNVLLLILLFAGYGASNTLFPHAHTDPVTGEVIVHSHFYMGGTGAQPGHSHPAGELQAIHYLGEAIFLGTLLIVLGAVCRRQVGRIDPLPPSRLESYTLVFCPLRGPPAFVR